VLLRLNVFAGTDTVLLFKAFPVSPPPPRAAHSAKTIRLKPGQADNSFFFSLTNLLNSKKSSNTLRENLKI
ncbi:MAG: hypothetical protein WCL08_01805, partial [Verrucomicrobiota bacterium]